MGNQIKGLPNGHKPVPGKFTRTLWWFSTAIPEVIKDCTTDRYRARIIGAAVVFTWIYATVAWMYFWSLSISSPFLFVPLGLLIGFGILSIDRMLIASINKNKKSKIAITFRVLLAILLGSFIAQPILLWMFEKDISQEISIVQEEKVQEKRTELLSIYQSEKEGLIAQQNKLDIDKSIRYAALERAEKEYINEIDGTGGSKKFGIAGIAREKEKAYLRSQKAYSAIEESQKKELSKIDDRITSIDSIVNYGTEDFRTNKLSQGFLIRVNALQSLFEKDEHFALQKRYYLILLILVLFELIPIISKLYLPTGSYDEKVRLQDQLELRLAQINQEQNLDFHQHTYQVAQEADKLLSSELYKLAPPKQQEQLELMFEEWKSSPQQSFEEFLNHVNFKLMRNRNL
ncbi:MULTISPECIES: DUF4407 domain-containing protein [unclassified Lentimicrobium]|uniref:DUF4407 domain-containing protein n=1 Tax=unclassified Lentimicrobium TaxID=2677434 RepID=UPI001557C7E8|nr:MULTISPECIES: DUF4407 domain-containing protein [unclassified Lentimicrobium]NPD46708.1 DUF4407 domain-containing protein [Lentimicrobium sp. S6]NPD85516.1 DUF4407 domain-containing protein [Lentimicrobium sp. L6]